MRSTRSSSALALGLILMMTGAAWAGDGHCGHEAVAQGLPGQVSVEVPEVTLLDQHGRRRRFREDVLGDGVVVMNFIFTTCTTVCPVLTATLAGVQEALGPRLGSQVRLVSVSVDPLRDTPGRLLTYSRRHGAREGWYWLTGEKAAVEEVLKGADAYTQDFTRHGPVTLVGDARTGTWFRLNGYPRREELLAKVEALLESRGAGLGRVGTR